MSKTMCAKQFIPRPKTHAAKPVGYQTDLAGGPEVPAFADTAAGRELRRLRLIHRLSTTACGRACGGFTAAEWRQIEDGELVLDSQVAPLAEALEKEVESAALR